MIFATNNKNKAAELEKMLQAEGVSVKTPSDLGLILVPAEDGNTFEENALQKATETLAFLKEKGHFDQTIISDDSGIEIDAMPDELGVQSALFMGEDTPYDIRNKTILDRLKNEKNRAARFVCVIACALPTGKTFTTRATIEGEIAFVPAGENGFGYDPIFFVPHLGKTTAELSSEEKNKISHRGQALRAMVQKLKEEGLL